MNVSLSQQSQEFLEQAVAAGLFPHQSQALDEAISLLRKREELKLSLQQAADELDRGDFTEYGPGDKERFVADIKALAREATKNQ